MKKRAVLLVAFLTAVCFASAQNAKQTMQTLISENFALAKAQYKYMMTLISPDKMPQSYNENDKKINAREIQWWCSGFYPGTLWYIYEQTNDETIKKEAERVLSMIEPNKTFKGNHDLGFMMYCSFGNAYRITKDKRYKDIIFSSAQTLSLRYRPSIKAIQSWDSDAPLKCPVIIDNMMNLELLYWASVNGDSSRYKEIALNHANTTLKNHFRPNYSSYHVLDYNLATGAVLAKKTQQGAADCSAWSRGQGWALYGYTLMYRFSKDKKYLQQAEGIANFILNHPNLPADKVPYWDFDAPHIPKRDASAAAVMASALLELGQYTIGAQKQKYIGAAEKMLQSLSSDVYRVKAGENGGFLLKHSTGALPINSEVDVPLIYADYYFLEALKRYKDWYL
jgi:unsaturated chondroitin disaccharide hydrolase